MRQVLTLCAVMSIPLCGLAHPASGQCGSGTFTTMAEWPGGTIMGVGAEPVINQDGTVAFWVRWPDNRRRIYTTDGQTLTELAVTGVGNPFDRVDGPAINNLGEVCFRIHDGVYKSSGGSLIPIALRSTTYPHPSSPRPPDIDDEGQVVFVAGTSPPSIHIGSGGPVTTLVSGPEFASVDAVAISNTGVVIFRGVFNSNWFGMISVPSTGGPFTTLLDMGTNYYIKSMTTPGISNIGHIAFHGPILNAYALHTLIDGVLTTVVTDPNSWAFGYQSGFISPSINSQDQIAFNRRQADGTWGIYTGPDPVLHKIIERGDPLANSTIAVSGQTLSMGYQALNDAGQIVFRAILADGREGVYRYEPGAGEAPVCVAGGPYTAECQGATTQIALDGTASFDPDDCPGPLTYAWSSDCPGASFDDPASATPILTVDSGSASMISCSVTLTVDDGAESDMCTTAVTISDSTAPVIALNGDASLTVGCGETYTELGATVTDTCDTTLISATVGGDVVDPSTAGTYIVTYDAVDAAGNAAEQVSRTVTVLASDGPVITLNGPSEITLECHADSYVELGATASDECEIEPLAVTIGGDVVDAGAAGVYVVTYDAVNSAGIPAEQVVRTVTVVDTTDPVLALNGPDTIILECQVDDYVELGAVADDTCEGTLEVAIGGDAVDTGAPGTYLVTYDAVDSAGNPAETLTRTVIVQDTLPPEITVDSTPIVVVDADCSGSETVAIPSATADDLCGGALPVTDDAPAVFPAGETTVVTYSATDAFGNTGTAQVEVTVLNGADIRVNAAVQYVGPGSHPGANRQPLAGILVGAYDTSAGSCARQEAGGPNVNFQHYPAIFANCTPDATAETNVNGEAILNVPAGDYLVLTYVDSDGDGEQDTFLAERANQVHCEDLDVKNLRLIVNTAGKGQPGKTTKLTGSELLIVEPEYVVWDQAEQLYPFVFEAQGAWGVVAAVTPPEGFIADYDELATEVADEIKALQFTVVEVGSDLLPTETVFDVTHNGRKLKVRSNVGIQLTERYALSRGFDPDKLRGRGLIATGKGGR